jgi:ribosomal protein S18 acetylase RimI-like enzyme
VTDDPIIVVERVAPQPLLVESLVRELPEWFGIEDAIVEYVERSHELPTYTASLDGEPVGVLVLEHHNQWTAEMYVLAVSRRFHRRGVGRALVETVEANLRGTGTSYVLVKTLGPSHPSPEYSATRSFYEALGYRGLEEFAADSLWPGNPCLIMAKHLDCGHDAPYERWGRPVAPEDPTRAREGDRGDPG